jgi:hypothetical protein
MRRAKRELIMGGRGAVLGGNGRAWEGGVFGGRFWIIGNLVGKEATVRVRLRSVHDVSGNEAMRGELVAVHGFLYLGTEYERIVLVHKNGRSDGAEPRGGREGGVWGRE